MKNSSFIEEENRNEENTGRKGRKNKSIKRCYINPGPGRTYSSHLRGKSRCLMKKQSQRNKQSKRNQ